MRRSRCAFGFVSSAAPADEPFTINVIESLTGPAAFAGVEEKTALGVYEGCAEQSRRHPRASGPLPDLGRREFAANRAANRQRHHREARRGDHRPGRDRHVRCGRSRRAQQRTGGILPLAGTAAAEGLVRLLQLAFARRDAAGRSALPQRQELRPHRRADGDRRVRSSRIARLNDAMPSYKTLSDHRRREVRPDARSRSTPKSRRSCS